MKTKDLKIIGNWRDVLNDCRASVNKAPLEKDPSDKFRKQILMAEHTPVRNLHIRWKWSIPSWCATHWVRHSWYSLVSTSRPDKTGQARGGPDSLVEFIGEANPHHLIDTQRKRLCNTASSLTRKYAEDLKETISQIDPDIAFVQVPHCIYRGGCPEPTPCGFYDSFVEQYGQTSDLHKRYEQYNEWFAKHKCTKGEED